MILEQMVSVGERNESPRRPLTFTASLRNSSLDDIEFMATHSAPAVVDRWYSAISSLSPHFLGKMLSIFAQPLASYKASVDLPKKHSGGYATEL